MAKAAKQLAVVEGEAPAPPKGPSMIMQIVALLLMTVAALGIGWVTGGMLKGEGAPATEAATPAAGGGHGAAPAGGGHGEAAAEGEHGDAPANPLLVQLAPITTNLAAPNETWIRLEASLVLDQPAEPPLIEAVHQDLLAFVRTLKMHQIEGASGFQHLKADLEERAAIRSDGHVKNVLIRTLLFE